MVLFQHAGIAMAAAGLLIRLLLQIPLMSDLVLRSMRRPWFVTMLRSLATLGSRVVHGFGMRLMLVEMFWSMEMLRSFRRLRSMEMLYGHAWIYGDAQVFDNARVKDNTWVFGWARVCGGAEIFGHAHVYGNVVVSGNARVRKDLY